MTKSSMPVVTAPSSRNPSWPVNPIGRIPLFGLMFGAVIGAALRGMHTGNRKKGTLFLDDYWAQYFLLNYRDSFHHRALVGSVLRALQPQGVSVIWLNLIAAITLGCILLVILKKCADILTDGVGRLAVAASAILLFSCLTSVLFETFGDLLQIALLLTFAGLFLCFRTNSAAVAAFIAAVIAIVAMEVHEASIFLMIPALIFPFARGKMQKSHLALLCGVMLVLLLVSLKFNNLHAQLTFMGKLYPHAGPLGVKPEVYESFRELLHDEHELFFSSKKLDFLYLMRFEQVFCPVLSGLLLLTYLLPFHRFNNYIKIWCFLFLTSLPLYVIAHDWGRFTALTFFLALFVEGALFQRGEDVDIPFVGEAFASFAVGLRRWSLAPTTIVAALLFLLFSANPNYRVHGMEWPTYRLCLPLLIACFVISYRDQKQMRHAAVENRFQY